jgi:membrane protein DedA with SNARE-associated domain
MNPLESLELLERYSFLILPVLVVAEQVGVPLPAVPALLAVGALAAHGRGNVLLVIGAMTLVALVVDFGWYQLGRRRGAGVLARLCRLTLEPDSCVRSAENIFVRYGAHGLLIAKFVPGLTTLMPPLAGVFAVNRLRFALYDIAGVVLWSSTWIGLGYAFSDAITVVAARAAGLGKTLALVVVAGLVGWILLKWVRRRLFLRMLRMARVSPGALKARLDKGEDVTVIDLRTALDVAATPYGIPGSRWLTVEQIDAHESEILRARELVLYCS